MLSKITLTTVSAICFAATTFAQTPMALQNTKDMKWMPTPNMLPKGAEISVLSGDPTKAGEFVMRIKMPANYNVPAHWHSTDEYLTIISGSFYGGMGDALDRSKGMEVKAGGFVCMPAQMHHFAYTKGPAIVQITAMGPFDIHYLDPATDPTKMP